MRDTHTHMPPPSANTHGGGPPRHRRKRDFILVRHELVNMYMRIG
jgi:hypothetical protein